MESDRAARGRSHRSQARPDEEPPGTDIDARRLLGAPHAWLGRNLRFVAEVQDVITDRAFTLETGLSGPGSDLLVLSSVPLPGLRIRDDRWSLKHDKIILEGMLKVARPAALEPALGWDFPPDLEAVIDGRIVLVATAVLDAHAQ